MSVYKIMSMLHENKCFLKELESVFTFLFQVFFTRMATQPTIIDDDVIVESSSSGPATPMASNPGTPRSLETEVRNTPPPPAVVGQVMTPATSIAQQQAAMAMLKQAQLPQSKYGQLLAVIEDMGKDIRPTYSGSKTSAERLKRGIVHARILVRECLMECERAARS